MTYEYKVQIASILWSNIVELIDYSRSVKTVILEVISLEKGRPEIFSFWRPGSLIYSFLLVTIISIKGNQ